ncbi:globin [Microplitis mediator]|uniref:globin n=1 Tax=Microplitis demolitor TaxID=69319 RepID=UPI0004CCD778|nr:globin [Microplitis demolitor]XP_008546779.1 globin [Microplitis demolitor]XP_057332215.1 globin [Microplitis mediator]XP_057332216.1 globin [Microplitis mediator]
METLWRKIWGHSNEDAVDPVTGLSGREIKLVQSTWAIASKDPVGSGIAIMSGFFERYPEYQSFFPGFKDVPLKDLPGNKRFQAHAVSVITALNSTIDALSDVGLLEATLVTLGERHGKRGQTAQQFLHLKLVVMDVLRQTLGNKFTKETEEAWTKTLDAAYTHIFKGLSS